MLPFQHGGHLLNTETGLPQVVSDDPNYGPELVENGDFGAWTDDNPDWWVSVGETGTSYVTEVAGGARFYTEGAYLVIYKPLVLTVGTMYHVEVKITDASVALNGITLEDSFAGIPTISTVGTHTFDITATATTLSIKRSGVVDMTISLVSVREVIE